MSESPFDKLASQTLKLLDGLEVGVVSAIKAAPIWIRQETASRARQKLNSSFETFMGAFWCGYEDNVLVAELDETDWLANAVESGASAFDMRKGLLTSNKAKTSKDGWRYMSVPIRKMPNAKPPGTEAGQDIHQRLVAALENPVFVLASSKNQNGAVVNMERLVTGDPKLAGLYRVRRFKDVKSASANKDFMSSQYILFKTISQNPATLVRNGKESWKHPGIQPAHIFDAVESWVNENLPALINATIAESIQKSMRS